ncbi:MAG: hypothetical protein HY537_03395 [Deltaproteobacteria bacterium]|nr:hypothetical protein [Deltaproteobacteria bacterium]
MMKFPYATLVFVVAMILASCKWDPGSLLGKADQIAPGSASAEGKPMVRCNTKTVVPSGHSIQSTDCEFPEPLSNVVSDFVKTAGGKLQITLRDLKDGAKVKIDKLSFRKKWSQYTVRELQCSEVPVRNGADYRIYECGIKKMGDEPLNLIFIFDSIVLANESCGARTTFSPLFEAGCLSTEDGDVAIFLNGSQLPELNPIES